MSLSSVKEVQVRNSRAHLKYHYVSKEGASAARVSINERNASYIIATLLTTDYLRGSTTARYAIFNSIVVDKRIRLQ